MSLLEDAMNDIMQITTDLGDFATTVIFESPGGKTAEVQALFSDHTNTYDEQGMPINGKQTQIAVSELPLIAQNYPTRTNRGFISFSGHKVTIKYPDVNFRTYVVDDVRPDYTINLITLFLSEYGSN